jgi:catechol 1,2-dioxygenase
LLLHLHIQRISQLSLELNQGKKTQAFRKHYNTTPRRKLAHINMGSQQAPSSRFDATFTQRVINATGPKANPRMKEVIGPLLRHLHDFAREVNLTVDEWMAGVELINWAGQMSNDRRNEGQLVCDVLGLES